jgi:cytochrome bd-type quinol oxidase subunit 2
MDTVNSKKMFISLIPWVLFTIIAGRAGADFVGWAALVAGVLTLGIAIKGVSDRTADGSRSTLKVIDVAGIVTFAVMTVLAFTGSHGVREHIVDYGRAACALVLAIVMLGSLLVVPFTEQYAREQVPRAYWRSPVFKSLNRHISAAFGIAVLVMAAGHFVSGWLESRGDLTAILNLILNWAIPILVILRAIKYTDRVTDDGTTHEPAAA